MTYEFCAHLPQDFPRNGALPEGLVSGFVDECTVRSMRGDDERNEARWRYMKQVKQAQNLKLPDELGLLPNFQSLPDLSWIGLEIGFTLQTPWYSKDDRVFHVLDNPVRKDRVFGLPFMTATSWKGLLRWACRMQAGLRQHFEKGKKFETWSDPPWILHLFGHKKGEEALEKLRQGALVFYPSWFNKIDFEVINPHSRVRRAGTKPIYYEVVPAGATGTLWLLYAPLSGSPARDGVQPQEAIERLLEAIEDLLVHYGISAKRTVGWGTAKISEWKAYKKGKQPIQSPNRNELWSELEEWLRRG